MTGRVSAGAISLLCIGAIYAAPGLFFVSGFTPSAYVEESVGYRYFYSLRMAFGNEFPWLPQGQLPALVHVAIQRILSYLGLPESQLFPRVDIFSFLASLAPGLVAAIAAYRALRRLQFLESRILLGALSLILMTSTDLAHGPGWTVLPDYHVWVVPLSFLSLELLMREPSSVPSWKRDVILAGCIGGLAASIKITFAIFALPLVPVLLWRSPIRLRSTFVWMTTSGLVGLAIYTGVVWAYYGFGDIRPHFSDTLYFLQTQANTLPTGYSAWSFIIVRPLFFIVILLPAALALLGKLTRRIEPVAIAAFGLVSLLLAFQRLYSHTLIETYAFAVMEFGVAIWVLERAWPGRLIWRSAAVMGGGLVACSLIFFHIPALGAALSHSESVAASSARWRNQLDAGPLPIWILTTGNSYRPNSIESSLCKGGMDIFNPQWGNSSYIEKLFPHFKCAVASVGRPTKPLKGAIGFVRLPEETLKSAIDRVEEYYSVSFADYSCVETPAPGHVLISCRPRGVAGD